MPVFLDDEPITTSAATVGDLLDSVQASLEERQRVVVDVQVDGLSVPSQDLDALRPRAADDLEIRLFTADPRDLSVQILEQVSDRLGDAHELQLEAAELFTTDHLAEGMRKVGEAVEVWQHTQQAVLQVTGLLGIEFDRIQVEDQTLNQMIPDLLSQITQLRDDLAARDTVALADALQYEWPKINERWQAASKQLIEHILDAGPA